MESPDFESIKQTNILGHEYWCARDLAPLLGYEASWQNFERVIKDAIIAAQEGGLDLDENVNASINVSLGARGPEQKDYFLSKRACYLIARAPVSSQVHVGRNQEATLRARKLRGWRVCATNQQTAALGLARAVESSHDASLVGNVGRLTGHSLFLGPLDVQPA